MKTAGRWSWKSKAAKKSVTTYLPNELALKMDGAEARDLNLAIIVLIDNDTIMSRRAWRFILSEEDIIMRNVETTSSADLGGSSKYSKEMKTEVEKGSM